MFGIGFWELIFLLLIALLILGPERLPAVARKLGYWSGRARMVADALRRQIEREVDEVRSPDDPAAPPTDDRHTDEPASPGRPEDRP